MIKVTRLNGTELILNSDQFEKMESLPNTTITMMNGQKYIVSEPAEDIIVLIKQYNKEIYLDKKNPE